jgi:hypothetical protein
VSPEWILISLVLLPNSDSEAVILVGVLVTQGLHIASFQKRGWLAVAAFLRDARIVLQLPHFFEILAVPAVRLSFAVFSAGAGHRREQVVSLRVRRPLQLRSLQWHLFVEN